MNNGGSISPIPDKAAMLSALSAMFEPADVVELRAFHKGKKRTDAVETDITGETDLVGNDESLSAARFKASQKQKQSPCDLCGGSGVDPSRDDQCNRCVGSGWEPFEN